MLQQYLVEELHSGFQAAGRPDLPEWPPGFERLDFDQRIEVAVGGQGITGLTELHRKLVCLQSLFTSEK